MKKYFFIFVFLFLTLIFFYPVFKGLFPIPSDTIVGLYNPFRDFYANLYPHGIPFKNFLITDPIRQQFLWKLLSVNLLSKFQLPLWNPYSMTGTPLLGNFQSSPFYVFNLFLLLFPFAYGWTMLIILQVFLSGFFLYLYLKNLRLDIGASIFGGIIFSFCGFSIAWLEWGTIINTALWLPLILYFTDKLLLSEKNTRSEYFISVGIFLALTFSFLAGHIQTFFYLFLFFIIYFLFRYLHRPKKKIGIHLLIIFIPFAFFTAIQWLPTLQFSLLSARGIDLIWQNPGWFIPWQNLIQFISPDFFGNPATLNYWGIWNYGEFVGYIGILPLIFAIFCLFFRKDKKTLFFGTTFFLSLIFSLPTPFAKIPYLLSIPIVSSFQPTRLLFITDFSLAVLASLGINYFLKERRNILYPVVFIAILLVSLWVTVLNGNSLFKGVTFSNFSVSKNNLFLPTILFVISVLIIIYGNFSKNKKAFYLIVCLVVVFDLLRFGWKFTSFSLNDYLYPKTKTMQFLASQEQPFRIMSTDSAILPPNFSIAYKLQSLDGYDPLYLLRYGELIAAIGRNAPDIHPPFGFDRIITPQNYLSPFVDLLNVKYVLTFDNIKDPKFIQVFEEGKTKIYQNKEVLPRAFFIGRTVVAKSKQDAISLLFDKDFLLKFRAVVEDAPSDLSRAWEPGKTEITKYSENQILIKTENNRDGFLVLTDSFYPTWHAKIDGLEVKIYRTDYNFRGIIVPRGNHSIEFYDTII